MLVHWIWLATRHGLGDRAKVALLQRFGDPEDIFYADSGAFEGLTPEGIEALRDKDLSDAEQILSQCADRKIRILTFHDAIYPARLKNITDPPIVFYYKGILPDFDGRPLIGAVGTRQATPYGIHTAKQLGYQIARCGGVLVSGMAEGIDAMAMRGALTAGQTVVGILGCGADMVYPACNRSLFADVERHGCLLSEFPPGTPPMGRNFPKRNRIISGLSCGVLVIEAPAKSGALITARQAADQGRDVFVVPGNIGVDSCVGSNALLRDGAIAVSSGWDILSEYTALYPDKIHRYTMPGHQTVYPDEVPTPRETAPLKVAQKPTLPRKNRSNQAGKGKKMVDNCPAPLYIDEDKPSLNPEEQAIVDALKAGERLVDDVIAETGLPAGKVLAMLTLLEINGVVTRLPGKRAALKQQ